MRGCEGASAVVLARGNGQRLGLDKACLCREGRPLLPDIVAELGRQFPEVLVAAPRRKAGVLLVRLLYVAAPLFCTAVAATTPGEWLLLLAPGVALGAVALLVGLWWEEEVGLGTALAWWGASFVVAIGQTELLGHPVASWFFLILLPAPVTPEGLFLRKWAQLGAGLVLLFLALAACVRTRYPEPTALGGLRGKR